MKLLRGDQKSIRTVEKTRWGRLGMPHEIVMRHRTPQFMHVSRAPVFGRLLQLILGRRDTADAFGAFVEAGGPYVKVAERLRKYIFSVATRSIRRSYRSSAAAIRKSRR